MSRSGLRMAVAVYAWFTNKAPTSPSGNPGGLGKVVPWRLSPLMLRAKKINAWPSPSVATIDSTFGAPTSRRTMLFSVKAAMSAPAAMPPGNAIQ